jgi:CheY-like chemotaxis protein
MTPTELLPGAPLEGLRIFLVEDEFAILLLIEDMLISLGCKIAAYASTLAAARQRVENCDFDAAVLDINLSGKRIYPVAELLRQRNVPIVFSTGYGVAGIDAPWAHYPVVQKPFAIEQLARALAQATSRPLPALGAEMLPGSL